MSIHPLTIELEHLLCGVPIPESFLSGHVTSFSGFRFAQHNLPIGQLRLLHNGTLYSTNPPAGGSLPARAPINRGKLGQALWSYRLFVFLTLPDFCCYCGITKIPFYPNIAPGSLPRSCGERNMGRRKNQRRLRRNWQLQTKLGGSMRRKTKAVNELRKNG